MSKFNPFNSVIFNKVVMAATGFILVMFLLGHCLGNMQVFLGREVFNAYAHFLQVSSGELIWMVRIVMLISVVLHVYTSLKLKFINLAAKPEGYTVKRYIKSTIYSRTMIYTGIVIFLFATYHLLHFTIGVTNPEYKQYVENYGPSVNNPFLEAHGLAEQSTGGMFERHDAFKMVIVGFSNTWVSIFYIFAVIMLGFHLSHAIQSMFQTLGLSGPKLSPKLISLSKIIGLVLALGFASVPVAVLVFGFGKGVVGL